MLKKGVIITSIFIFIFSYSKSQDLPNGSFEKWVDSNNYENPESWDTNNEFGTIGGETPVNKTSDSHDGTTAVSVKTVEIFGQQIAGFLSITYEYSSRPEKLTGFYKGTIKTGDSITISISLLKKAGNKLEAIGTGNTFLYQTQQNYTSFEVPITYYTEQSPDSASINILSSVLSTPMDNIVYLDDLSFKGGNMQSSIEEKDHQSNLRIFPNPVRNTLNLKFDETDFTRLPLNIYDLLGNRVKTFKTSSGSGTYDVSQLQPGVYFYTILTSHGPVSGKFVKS